MALIEIYHVVADMQPVEQDETIREGMLVKLNANSNVVHCNVAGEAVYGVAGDSTVQSTTNANKSTPYSANLTIGAGGVNQQWTQNRVSDYGNETLASNRITVYTCGGRFATDQYDTTVITWTPMAPLYTTAAGRWTTTAGAANQAGILIQGPTPYPSGVPGTDTVDGSISLGDFITVILRAD